MCCNTGFSGVGVEPELIRINSVLKALLKNGVAVERFNLSNEPQAFISNEAVNDLINTKGIDQLPVAVLEGNIVVTGRYPTNEEFVKFLGILPSVLGEQPKVRKAIPKRPGGRCC
jgi:hypothetical protein